MPLIRKPYNQDQAEADYKAAGQVDTGSGQYNQDIGIMEPSKILMALEDCQVDL